MLKIKDNVDLEELKKFCFRFVEHKFLGKIDDNYYSYIGGLCKINVDCNSRFILLVGQGTYDCCPEDAEIIFDLIQAGLVEKVEGD